VARIEAAALTKRYGAQAALDSVDLTVGEQEFVALLGPSGCGKTTLLRLVAGFEVPDAGTLRLGGREVARAGWALPPEERHIGMVFQSYALWPHMSVAENVGFPARARGVPAAERGRRVRQALELVGLSAMAGRRPHALSGGQRQRVALARCLASRPAVVLLDEPLANLDAHLREAMQDEIRRFHREIGTTLVYVTHDQAEAMALADRVAVMNAGRIEQIAAPAVLYAEPATAMVAGFVGRGIIVPARVTGHDGRCTMVEIGGVRVAARGEGAPGEGRDVCLRPAELAIRPPGKGRLPARVTAVSFQGAASLVSVVTTGATPLALRVDHRGPAPEEGAPVGIEVMDAWLIPGAKA
jgi:iron(III) transport system ATP-binding protein